MSHAPVNATELSCAEYTEELTQFEWVFWMKPTPR